MSFTPEIASAFASLVVIGVVAGLVSVLFLSVQIGSLVDAAAARYLGRETTVGASFRAGLRVAPKIIAAGLLLFFGLLVGWLLLFLVVALANNALVATLGILARTRRHGVRVRVVARDAGRRDARAGRPATRRAPVVVALDGPPLADPRPSDPARGAPGRASTLISFIFVAAFISDDVVRLVLQNIVNVVATVLWAPVEWGTFTILYFDLRVRKEALDLQLAAEALPRQA